MTKARKKYDKLPEDSPRDTKDRKTRPLSMTYSAIILMSPATETRMKYHTEAAGYPSYSEYIRHLIDDLPPVGKSALVLNLNKATIKNLKRHAEDTELSLEEYIKVLSDLEVST
jgi:hypothetical protein